MNIRNQILKMSAFIFMASLSVFPACGNSSVSTTRNSSEQEKTTAQVNGETTFKLYNLKTTVRKMYEWSVPIAMLADNPGLNPTTPAAVEDAIEQEILDEMTTTVRDYEFNQDSTVKEWVISYSGITPAEISRQGLPGTFKVIWQNGLPVQFVLNEDRLNKDIEEGMMYLDPFEIGLLTFTISYDANGLPKSLSGKAMPFFGGGNYTETYSDYKFDAKGNWVRRKVITPDDTLYQYRSYEY